MSRIASVIMDIVAQGVPVSDLHIVEGKPLLGRFPRGYQSITKDNNVNDTDIDDFLSAPGIMGANWRQTLTENGGTYEVAHTLSTARVRLSVYETRGLDHSINIIGRIIPLTVPKLETLGIPTTVMSVMNRSKGLFIITGATGAGKSTTMASMLEAVNRTRPVHLLTIEDPIEYVFSNSMAVISQREIGSNVPSFRDGLALALRQRPDVLALGEVSDAESVETMLHAAESGHLVLATMHTRNSEETISKLFSYFDKDELPQKAHSIASSLIGCVTQALVPSTDGKKLFLASEVLMNNAAISQNIREMKLSQIRNALYSGSGDGMCLLNKSLEALVKEGKISKRDAHYAAYDVDDLTKLIGKVA